MFRKIFETDDVIENWSRVLQMKDMIRVQNLDHLENLQFL